MEIKKNYTLFTLSIETDEIYAVLKVRPDYIELLHEGHKREFYNSFEDLGLEELPYKRYLKNFIEKAGIEITKYRKVCSPEYKIDEEGRKTLLSVLYNEFSRLLKSSNSLPEPGKEEDLLL